MSSVGILGMGAIGSVVASVLAQNSQLQVQFFNRSHRDEIKIDGPDGQFKLPIQMQTTPPQDLQLDWLIVCLKEHHFADAHCWFAALIKPNTKVIVIRNGLHHTAPILEFTCAENCSACLIDCPTQPGENGVFHQLQAPELTLPAKAVAEEFSNLIADSNIQVNLISDFKTAAWKKVCESASLGGVLCSYRETCSVFTNREAITLYKKLLAESIEVARADNAQIDENFADDTLQKVLRYPPSKGSSMLTDLLLGKTPELGAKNGIICKIGEDKSVRTFHNQLVVNNLTAYF